MSEFVQKGNLKQRKSLNPATNPQQIIHQRYHNTELNVRQNPYSQSQSTISNHDHYSPDDLQKIFNSISKDKDVITVEDLYALLQDQGYSENLYSAVQMIALVDQKRKGFVSKTDFTLFFSNKNYVDQQKIPRLPKDMQQNRQWVKEIDQKWDAYRQYIDKDYCYYVAEKIRESRIKTKKN